MEGLHFDIKADGERFVIVWAGTYRSSRESCHMTQISCRKLEALTERSGLEFHYELHLGSKEKFIRLCCHIREYDRYKNCRTEAVLKKRLEEDGKDVERILGMREKLAEIFEKGFRKENAEFIARNRRSCKYKYNYLGLIRREIGAEDYDGALEEGAAFIRDTYPKAAELIGSVC